MLLVTSIGTLFIGTNKTSIIASQKVRKKKIINL